MKATTRRRWLVDLANGQEHVDADEVEVGAAGTLVFYRVAGRLESERTLLAAWAADTWRHCVLERDG